jgi:arabinose-5-phosphate isomerase
MTPADKVFSLAIESLKRIQSITKKSEFKTIINLLMPSFIIGASNVNSQAGWDTIYTTAVGKASQPARKMAATLSSNGRKAAFLDACDAMHGDMGAVQSGDRIVAFSNSGKTEEILRVLMKARERKITTILITGNGDSVLGREANYVLDYGPVLEACSLGLTPTTSCTVMLVIADALSMEVQAKIGLTNEMYSSFHHSGYLNQLSSLHALTERK